MGRYSVKRYKTKRRTRDLDLIYGDLATKESIWKLKNQPLDENKPGLGQYYCIECARYFENQLALNRHTAGKVHKRRVKDLRLKPYTNLEAEAASGINMERFAESVENYKKLEDYKASNAQEFDKLKNQANRDLDEIIIGAPAAQIEKEGQIDDMSIVDQNDNPSGQVEMAQ
ncbi:uncharacterized protein PRCAT00000047001 [Priceomyces carsonii]|uniref:uncharacterized protein n=1 Tax=Priceomyces carsonii TaxID=28549 RepID=UPI002ED81A24|nr:unnamed protein product [Priceomyces carsonii]